MTDAHAHCGFCGAPYPEGLVWPRTCAACGNTSYRNPLPVAVVLLPVDGGLLTIRRAIEPKRGELALPGGYINWGETWQDAAARELREETGITLQPASIRDFRVRSAPDGTLLVFGLAPPVQASDLPEFTHDGECSERVVIREPPEMAFSLHTEVVREFFERARRES